MDIRTKRIYETPDAEDGRRILVDRLWPRGVTKQEAALAFWAKDLAPSTELRRWYGHQPERWEAFRSRYFAELDASPRLVSQLMGYVREGRVTFVYSSKERSLNNAVALRDYIESRSE